MNIDIHKIAALVAAQIKERFGHEVEAKPYTVSRTRSGDQYFSLPIKQDHGIFDMIIADSHLRLSAGEVEDAENGKHVSVRVGLHYNHISGGSNGSNVGTFWCSKSGELINFRAG